MASETLYRAAAIAPTGREGECWTDDLEAAAQFRSDASAVYSAEVDLDGAIDVEGYDHDEDHTPADDPEFRARHAAAGATWIRYDDETEQGREMTCYRLVRDIDLAAREVPADGEGE